MNPRNKAPLIKSHFQWLGGGTEDLTIISTQPIAQCCRNRGLCALNDLHDLVRTHVTCFGTAYCHVTWMLSAIPGPTITSTQRVFVFANCMTRIEREAVSFNISVGHNGYLLSHWHCCFVVSLRTYGHVSSHERTIRQSYILDSGFRNWISDSLSVEPGFWIPIGKGIADSLNCIDRIPKPRILMPQAKISRNS